MCVCACVEQGDEDVVGGDAFNLCRLLARHAAAKAKAQPAVAKGIVTGELVSRSPTRVTSIGARRAAAHIRTTLWPARRAPSVT